MKKFQYILAIAVGIFAPAFLVYANTTGSVLFYDGGVVAEDNAHFFWSGANQFLGIGTADPQSKLHIADGDLTVGGVATSTIKGNGSNSSIGGNLEVYGLISAIETVPVLDDANVAQIGSQFGQLFLTGNHGGIDINQSQLRVAVDDQSHGTSTLDAAFSIYPKEDSGSYDFLISNREDNDNILTFSENGNMVTLQIGTSSIAGCIVMGDSDGNGLTYVTANDGILSATTTKPSVCN